MTDLGYEPTYYILDHGDFKSINFFILQTNECPTKDVNKFIKQCILTIKISVD